MPKPTSAISVITNKTKRLIVMLVVQFFSGMALNVIGKPEAGDAVLKKVVAYLLVTVHVVNGIGLIVLGIIVFNQSRKLSDAYIKMKLRYGSADILLALISGILTVSVKSYEELFSFLMAGFFMLALLSYGSLYVKLKQSA